LRLPRQAFVRFVASGVPSGPFYFICSSINTIAACRCLDLDTLIHGKRAAGRPKNFEAIAELETLREERDRMS
jgi:hypothetical protein